MKSISFNCTKIEHSRTRVCGPGSPRQRKRTRTEIRVLKTLRVACRSSSCGLQRVPLVRSQVPHPPLHLLPVCLAEIDASAWILFFCFFSCSHSPHSPLLFFPYHSSFPNTSPSWPPSAATLHSAGWPLLGNLRYPLVFMNTINK